MRRRRSHFVELAHLPIPPVGRRTVELGMALLATAGLGYLSFWRHGRFRLTGLGWTLCASGCAIVVAILLLWLAVRLIAARMAYRPGPVDIEDLVDATGGRGQAPVTQDLTARLRQQLSTTGLYPSLSQTTATSAVQSAPPNFLDLLGEIDTDPKKLGPSLLRVFGRARPKVAYRVNGVLQLRDEPATARFGVTLTVTGCAIPGSAVYTCWASSWEDATREAGYCAMAAILPVTRLCRTPPWTAWQGRALPVRLFQAYQTAAHLVREDKVDQALAYYDRALREDPLNPYLRGEVAVAQRRLGLYLDALHSYHGAITCDGERVERYNTRLWESSWRRQQWWWYLRHLVRRPDLISVRYGYAQLIGTAEHTARQWGDVEEAVRPLPSKNKPPQPCPGDVEPPLPAQVGEPKTHATGSRAQVRSHLRSQLAAELIARYWPLQADLRGRRVADIPRNEQRDARDATAQILLPVDGKPVDLNRLYVFFQEAFVQELYRLARDHRLTFITRLLPGGRRPRITAGSLRLLRDVLAPMRLRWARDLHGEAAADPCPRSGSIPSRLCRRMSQVPWPVVPVHNPGNTEADRQAAMKRIDLLRKEVDNAMPGKLRQRWFPEWGDHYNAACVYAFALRSCPESGDTPGDDARDGDGISPTDRDRDLEQPRDPHAGLASEAVRELRAAAGQAESAAFAANQWWSLSVDPDLDLLRQYPIFHKFADDAYPRIRAQRYRTHRRLEQEITDYDQTMVAKAARRMEYTWHRRMVGLGTDSELDVHRGIDWLEGELTVWRCLRNVAADQARNWPERADLIRAVGVAARTAGEEADFQPALTDVEREEATSRPVSEVDSMFTTLWQLLDPDGAAKADGNKSGSGGDGEDDHAHRNDGYESPIARTAHWLARLRTTDAAGRPLRVAQVHNIAVAYAALWQHLAEWFESGGGSDRFRAALRRAPHR